MAYVKTDWENLPSTDTPIIDTSLNHMEDGIEFNDQRLNGTKSINNAIYANDFKCKNILPNYAISGGYSDTGYVASTNYITVQYIPVKPNTQYTLSALSLDLTKYTAIRIVSFNINRTFIRRNSAITLENITSFTTDNDAYYIAICFYTGQTANTNDYTQGQLEIGDTATTYTPYFKSLSEIGSINSGTLSSSPDVRYARVGDLVSVYCHFTSATTINAYNSLVVGTLPNDCKPLLPVRVSASAKTSSNVVVNGLLLRVLDNGDIDIQNWSSSTLTFSQLDVSVTYIANNVPAASASLLSIQSEEE